MLSQSNQGMDDTTTGSKRSIASVLERMQADGHDPAEVPRACAMLCTHNATVVF
jgi:hypothetical protein